jgi:hypothetical protein
MLVNCLYCESGIVEGLVGKLQINWERTAAEQEHGNGEEWGELRVSVNDSLTRAGSCTPLRLELGSQAQHTHITTIIRPTDILFKHFSAAPSPCSPPLPDPLLQI